MCVCVWGGGGGGGGANIKMYISCGTYEGIEVDFLRFLCQLLSNTFSQNKFQLIPGVQITVGHDKDDGGRWPYAGTAGAVEQMGAKHFNKDVHISFEMSKHSP